MARDLRALISQLNELIGMDRDLVRAYEVALTHIDVESVRARARDFLEDHRRHASELTASVSQLGGRPRADATGSLADVFRTRGRLGTAATLRALERGERLCLENYRQALDSEWTVEVRELLSRNTEEARRHLDYLEEQLRTRAFEREATRTL